MSQEQLLTQLAALEQANAALSQEVTELKTERDRLVGALQLYIPPPTAEELAEAAGNAGKFSQVLDEIALELGVRRHGR